MPTRSSTSSVLVWPDSATVRRSLDAWAARLTLEHPGVLAVGYFGSYARGDWGVGSDLDLVIIVGGEAGDERMKAACVPYEKLPVPADVLIYTPREFAVLCSEATRFATALRDEVVWVFGASPLESEARSR
jgi:predicted nucleotidyltransferase